MLDGTAMIVLLTVGMIKKSQYKSLNIFQIQNLFEEE